jgi:hypothetical protein
MGLLLACGADPALVRSPLVTDSIKQRLRKYERLQAERKLPRIDVSSLASITENLLTFQDEVSQVMETVKREETLEVAASINCLRTCYSTFAGIFRDTSRVASPVVQLRDELLATLFMEMAAEDVERVNFIAREDAKGWQKLFRRLPDGDHPVHLADFFLEKTVRQHIIRTPDIPACLLALNNQLLTVRPLLDQLLPLFNRFHKAAMVFIKRRRDHVQGHLKTIAGFRDLKMQERLAKCGLRGQTMEAILEGQNSQGRYLDALEEQLKEQNQLFQELQQTVNRFITGLLL